MKGYYKLPHINYRIATHEGAAVRRLASQANELLPMPASMVPDECKKQFCKLKELIENEIGNLPKGVMVPVGLGGIQNKTAVKYIKLLIEIEYKTNEK
jgi:hypothetical protein